MAATAKKIMFAIMRTRMNVINPFACELISLQKHAFACLTYPEFKKIPIWCLWFLRKVEKTFHYRTLNNSAVAIVPAD
jgi:hypothetical protein